MYLRLSVLILGWFALSLVANGCLSPTLPLPPPIVDDITAPDSNGLVSIKGTAYENNYVSCLNERSEKGVIVMSDQEGRYALEIEAKVGDDLTLWQNDGMNRSAGVRKTVPEK